MKQLFILLAAILMTAGVIAQTATTYYTITLNDGQVLNVQDASSLYSEDDKAMCKDYAGQITSSALYRTMSGDQIGDWRMESCLLRFVIYTREGYVHIPVWWRVGEIEHKLVQNKLFRDFLSGRVNNLLVSMCQMYPASTKQKILGLLDESIKLVDQMEKHSYKIVKITHKEKDGYTWIEDALQKDSQVFEENKMSQEEIDRVVGLEGMIIRRVLYDGLSLREIKDYFLSARKAVADTDVSKNATFAACYTINQDMKVWTTLHGNLCQFASGKTVDNASSITYMEDVSGKYYKIVGQYQWMSTRDGWKNCANSVLYDNKGNKIYEEIVTK